MSREEVGYMGVRSLRDICFQRLGAQSVLAVNVLFLLSIFAPLSAMGKPDSHAVQIAQSSGARVVEPMSVSVFSPENDAPFQKKHLWAECKQGTSLFVAILLLQALLIFLLVLSRNSLRKAQSAVKASEERLKDALETSGRVFRYMETVRENERKSIAREIHDELGQALTALKIDLFRLRGNLEKTNEDFSATINQMSMLVSDIIQNVQRISSELRPRLLDDLGLIAAIDWFAQEFSERMGIPCTFIRQSAEICIGTECSTALFRIVQESLTNISRHAQASHVEITLGCGNGRAFLKIVDDGVGISKDQLTSEESLGLLGIMERANMCGGVAEISGHPGKGTTVTAIIPCSEGDCGQT